MKLLILALSICLTIEYREISQNSEVKTSTPDNFYLSLSGFKSGEEIYIEVSYYNKNSASSYSISYRESNSLSDSDFSSYTFNDMSTFIVTFEGKKSRIEADHYTIKLTGDYTYLLLKFRPNYSEYTYTIAHSSDSGISQFVFTIILVVAFCALAFISEWCRKKCNKRKTPKVDDHPLTQPQPMIPLQPIVEQPQPIVTQPQPIVDQPYPIVDQPYPIVAQPQPIIAQPQPILDQPYPIVEQPQPIVEQPQPIVEQPQPIVDQPYPIIEQPQPIEAQPKPYNTYEEYNK